MRAPASSSDSEPEEAGVSGSEEATDASSSGEEGGSDQELDPRTKDVPLGQLLAAQQSGGAGGRQRRGGGPPAVAAVQRAGKAGSKAAAATSFRRENKNRPVEQSSKRPVPRLRQVVDVPRRAKDPRFNDTVAQFQDGAFKKRYAFLYDEQLPAEKEALRKSLKGAKSAGRRAELQGEVRRVEQQMRSAAEEQRRQEAAAAAKAQERQAVKAGKKPFFLKKGERKRQELVARFHELKAQGRLQKVLAKKRKKNAAKDHRYVPAGRRGAAADA